MQSLCPGVHKLCFSPLNIFGGYGIWFLRRFCPSSSKVGAVDVLCWSKRVEILHAQGKRNPSKMVGLARWCQRANTLKPYSQQTSHSNHTRVTALSNSMKLSHTRRATQDGRVMVERSERMWSTGEGNGKSLHYSCLENPMNSMKRQNDRLLKEELPTSVGAQYATGDQ